MKDLIINIINNNKDYTDEYSKDSILKILIDGIIDTCNTDEEYVEAMINSIYSLALIYDNIIAVLANSTDRKSVDEIAKIIMNELYEGGEDDE